MKPFLKWAGGKSRLVPRIGALLPKGRRLVEPFMGSGAVFLGLEYDGYLAADVNEDLVALYGFLKRDAERGSEAFIDGCARLFVPENNTAERYAKLRAEFNVLERGDERRAQLFLYLNRHCFNGLCRMNRSGHFNVPFGRMKSPYFPRREMMGFAAKARRIEFRLCDFRTLMADVRDGDVVYCDPPYVPLSQTASFSDYAAGGFSAEDQLELADLCFELADRGVTVLLSNHDTDVTRDLYRGARFEEIKVSRSISAAGGRRGKASEVLVLFEPGRAVNRRLVDMKKAA